MNSEAPHIVIIGLGTGGLFSSRAATRFNRKTKITFIEKRDYHMFSPCGIPYAIEGQVKDFEDLKHSVPTTRSIDIKLKHKATKIDTQNKKVKVKDLENEKEIWIEYDKLIISTGSKPLILPVPGANELLGKGIYVVSNPEEGKILRDAAEKSKTAVVIGGGAIGMEIALALKHLGLEVHITKRSEPALPRNLDPDMGKILIEHLHEKELKVYFGKGIESINGKDKVESVTIAGETIPTDIVVMAAGVSSNSELASEAGIACERGAILTNEKMETSVPDVYAIGDNCWSFNLIDKTPSRVALATTAYRQALVAGVNAAGGNASYGGTLGTFVTFVGDLETSCTGYNTPLAEAQGFNVVTGRANTSLKPKWMPDAKNISIKILADAETGKIIGGQAIGEEGTDMRINLIALAIRKGMTLEEFSTIELAYCPPVSELYDPLLMATDAALRRLEASKRKKKSS
ncbi:MAG: FAD-dependent oxidoreductase [Candidatus Bathyarchaeota archaeon]|nr:FAD-dependent oxidoreductase [Candidatus Bathyarchaeota archaeon]